MRLNAGEESCSVMRQLNIAESTWNRRRICACPTLLMWRRQTTEQPQVSKGAFGRDGTVKPQIQNGFGD